MEPLATEDPSSLASPLVAPGAELLHEASQEAPSPGAEVPELAAAAPTGEEEVHNRTCLDALGIEEALRVLQPYAEKYAHWFSAVQPWRHFMTFSWPKGVQEVFHRVPGNFRTYLANYGIVALVCLGAAIVMCPPTLIVVALLGFVWSVVLKRMDDPTWKVKIGRLELGKDKQLALFGSVTLLAMLLFVAPLLVWVVPSCVPLVLLHAVLHPAPAAAAALAAASPEPEKGRLAREVALRGEAEPATDSAE